MAEQELTGKLNVKVKQANLTQSLALQLKADKERLLNKISVARAANSNLTIECANMRQEKVRLEADLRLKTSVNVKLVSENADLSRGNASLTCENESLTSEKESLTSEKESLASNNQELELEIERLQEITSNLKDQLSDSRRYQGRSKG